MWWRLMATIKQPRYWELLDSPLEGKGFNFRSRSRRSGSRANWIL